LTATQRDKSEDKENFERWGREGAGGADSSCAEKNSDLRFEMSFALEIPKSFF
jgi:hypothetical protein